MGADRRATGFGGRPLSRQSKRSGLSKRSHHFERLGRWASAGAVVSLLAAAAAAAEPEPLSAEALAVVEARIAPVAPATERLSIGVGGTRLLERKFSIPRARITRPAASYEVVFTDIGLSPGLFLHDRADRFSLVRSGPSFELTVVYAVAAEPDARRGGPLGARLVLRERVGLGNEVVSERIAHRVTVVPPRPSPKELAADFFGYRHHLSRARAALGKLEQAGLRGLSLQDRGPVLSTERLNPSGLALLAAFEQDRRRAWAAHRHLVAAARSGDPRTESLAKTLLDHIAKPRTEWRSLPDLELTDRPASASSAPADKTSAPASKSGDGGFLAPVSEFRAGSAGSEPPEPERKPEPEPEPEPAPAVDEEEAWWNAQLASISTGLVEIERDGGDRALLGRRFYLPNYSRSLLLDDPNIAHGVAVRASLAQVTQPEAATTVALFYFAQVGLTKDLGLELTMPTQLLDTELGAERQTLYLPGNPLIAAKYRFHLPQISGRKPALTVRARWGIAAFRKHSVPASTYFAEDFSFEPNVVDTFAFLLERSHVGLGASFAWQVEGVHLAAQLTGDGVFPTPLARDAPTLLAIGYGASVGASPFGDVLTGYLEGRAVSLLGGPLRTEAMAYAGLRSRLFDGFEPAVWVGVPVGSVAATSSPQVGIELRFGQDVRSVVQVGGKRLAAEAR